MVNNPSSNVPPINPFDWRKWKEENVYIVLDLHATCRCDSAEGRAIAEFWPKSGYSRVRGLHPDGKSCVMEPLSRRSKQKTVELWSYARSLYPTPDYRGVSEIEELKKLLEDAYTPGDEAGLAQIFDSTYHTDN
jgi:hypothetical protein